MRWENALTIEATVDTVWRLTVDVENWPSVSPKTITSVVRLDEGPLRVGSRARIVQPGQPAAVWTVTRLDAGHDFTWQTARMGITIVGSHRLEPVGEHCRNTLAVAVSGRGSRLFGWLFGGLLRRAIRLENAGFRDAARRGS
jgi:hypothetical protein